MTLDGLRVVDASSGLAGAYAAKLLCDLGADVVAVEPHDGHALAGRPRLLEYLRTSQRVAPAADRGVWTAWCDVLVGDDAVLGADGLGAAPVTVAISSFGRGGPDAGRELPEPVLQARSGSLSAHGQPDRPPLTVAGELGEYVAGTFAALGALTAWWRVARTGVPEGVDVSVLEAMQLTLVTVPTLMARFPGGRMHTSRFVMIPGNEPCADGRFAGITTITAQQWRSLLRVIGREDLLGDEELATMLGRLRRAPEVTGALRAFTLRHPAAEVVERCAAERVPAAVVGDGELLPTFEQLVDREVFVAQPGRAWIRPRSPFRLTAVAPRDLRAPRPVEASAASPARSPRRSHEAVGERPFAGLRVLDLTAFWSGPFATAWLCAMGADVIKVESVQRPDAIRFSATIRPDQDPRFYEKSPLFHASNLGKRGITLDLGQPEGRALAEALVARVDVVCENFTPRVVESFGLGYEHLAAIRPDVVMLRIPAFGLTGPWRDRPGFAQTMEQVSGMAWRTGYADGPPIIPGGVVDPLVGAHAALALVAALDRRARTGEGGLVEVAMVEVATAVTAEQVIEHSATGVVLGRRGEHGVYRCAGSDAWVAVDDTQDPLAPGDRAAWCVTRDPAAAAAELLAEGIAAAPVVPAFAALDDPQLVARRFFEPIEHRDVGLQHYPGWPVRLSGGPARFWTAPAPTLGEHTDEVLRSELGVDDETLARLHAERVVGEQPVRA